MYFCTNVCILKVTIVDIAKKLNITPSTVSRALAGNKRISEKTRELVKNTADTMGYQPNQLAAALRKGVNDSIGMVVPRINRHYFSNVICGVEEVLNKAGYNLSILQSSELLEKETNAINTLRQSRVGGIIISLSLETENYDHLKELNEQIPLVQFDRVCESITGPKLVNANYDGTRQATQYLLDKGCKRFLHLAGKDTNNVYKERKRGFTDALKDAGIPEKNIEVVEIIPTREEGRDVITKLWKHQQFDAVICAGDYAALGVMEALKQINVSIPDEVKVLGFANEPFAELMSPSLSSVEQYGEEMGRKAAYAMLNKIKDDSLDYTEVLPVKLICRESTR